MEKIILLFVLGLFISEINGCHDAYHLSRKKRSVESENKLNELITYFTDCMNTTSNITFDWYSATDWAIQDSNWYYYTDKTDCAGEQDNNETECWKQRVDLFVDESLSPAVKSCIESYARASERNEYYSEPQRRKKRRARGGGFRGPRRGGIFGGGRGRGNFGLGRGGRGGGSGRIGGVGGGGRIGGVGGGGRIGGGGGSGRIGGVGGGGRIGGVGGGGRRGEGGGSGRIGGIGGGGNNGGGGGNGRNGGSGRSGELGGNVSPGMQERMQGINGNSRNGNNENGQPNRNNERSGGSMDRNGRSNSQNKPNMPGRKNPMGPRPKHQRNSECPTIPRNYRSMLARLIPPSFRPPRRKRRRSKRSDSEWIFNITSVVDFVDKYAICGECSRYTGNNGIACFTDRFDRLTRYSSTLKTAIQKVNSQFAEGIIGNCRQTYWTEWFNIDNPISGTGDSESLTQIKSRFPSKVCTSPSGIQAQLSQTRQPFGKGNNSVDILPNLGLICRNRNQANGRCQDYRVRFCCKDYVGKCPLNHGWTQYFDEQNPTSLGDFEILTPRLVTTNQGQLCRNPTAIAARSRTTNRTYQLTGQTVHVFINRGLFCSASQQRDRKCEDYEVRYCCPSTIGNCENGHRWTKWFNSRPTSFGDIEALSRIKTNQHYRCLSEPSAIEAQIARNRRSYIEGNNKLYISPQIGLICSNRSQGDRSCENYRVRFCCQQPPKNRSRPKPPMHPPPARQSTRQQQPRFFPQGHRRS